MTRSIGQIRVEFLDPGQRPDIVYRALEPARSARETRRFQRVMLLSPGAILYRGDLPRCTYPLGLGYLGANLERNGYDVSILDCLAEGYELFAVSSTYDIVGEDDLEAAGVNGVIYANHLLRAAYPAMARAAESILRHGRAHECASAAASLHDILSMVAGGADAYAGTVPGDGMSGRAA
ncbi:hypothetical protein [Burkholderia plantarii]|uniref:hypothetical protein n=1 Tax=Burkholderia plantarii TaxID=41899 RepID=UPI0006D8ADDF|nr:hypothetical protein [Burkholderia plantarii]ALK32755.1 Radical SAM domain protein [Burkholderia plantarii]GLZ22807.1 hypothetical protein Bpla01_63360 [Burkholderia plantarii]